MALHFEPDFLNEFCDLQSKAYRQPKTVKQAQDTTVHLDNTNSGSSMKVSPQKPRIPSSVSFGFGSSGPSQQHAPIFKKLNCSIIVVAPPHNGLLVNVNSFGLPKNLTKLGITLNHGSVHAQQVHLEGTETSSQYLLNKEGSSKIAINLHSSEPIDWSLIHFDIVVNVFKKVDNNTGCPNKKWFDCGEDICVPSWLVCDGTRNCPNGNDEMLPYHCYSPLFLSIAASTTLALVLILIVVVVILVSRRRNGGLNKQHRSMSDSNVLTADGDLISHDGNNSSKLDLTQESAARSNTYFKSNLYLGGFENPVWSTGTLTKQQVQQGASQAASTNNTPSNQSNVQQAVANSSSSTSYIDSTNVVR